MSETGSLQILDKVSQLQDAISEGAVSFLTTEYKYMGVFSVSLPHAMASILHMQCYNWFSPVLCLNRE
jgi:Na+/H+-translocating membrane pyrophosphatase